MSKLDQRSVELRRLVLRGLAGGRRGHIGPSLSLVEIIRVLFDDYLKYRHDEPEWAGRDRFLLSKGHGCLALYAVLADKGFFPVEELDRFCEVDGILGGHPEASKIPGVEASTGALGHGLPLAIGMALAARIRQQPHRVVVVLGDGEINEGSVWETALHAGKHGLSSLTVLVDYNKMQSYGETKEVVDLEPMVGKWRSFNFAVREVDGHDVEQLRQVLTELPFTCSQPNAIICHTIKGRGIPFAEGCADWHHKALLSQDDLEAMSQALKCS